MSRSIKLSVLAVLTSFVVAAGARAQTAGDDKIPRAVITIYHIAPGKHLEFMKWLAQREAVEKEAGAPARQIYAHIDGANFDYLLIEPQLAPAAQVELEKKIDAAMKKKGLTTGPKLGLEIRQFIADHTDTMVAGPLTAAQIVDAYTK
jgi:hypothetical protein